jgi:hypothetical protein
MGQAAEALVGGIPAVIGAESYACVRLPTIDYVSAADRPCESSGARAMALRKRRRVEI